MKTYLVVVESVYDCEANHEYYSFINKSEARKKLEEVKAEMLNELDGWEQEEDSDGDGFQMWLDGYYAGDHCRVEVLEVEVQCTIDQLVNAITYRERAEFNAKAEQLEYDEDGEYDVLEHVGRTTELLCNFDEGPVDCIIRSIHNDDGYFTLIDDEGEEIHIKDVECGHLSFLTAML